MTLKCHKYGICPNYSMHIKGGSMPIYIPHMDTLVLKM